MLIFQTCDSLGCFGSVPTKTDISKSPVLLLCPAKKMTGSAVERLAHFKRINMAGEILEQVQELTAGTGVLMPIFPIFLFCLKVQQYLLVITQLIFSSMTLELLDH